MKNILLTILSLFLVIIVSAQITTNTNFKPNISEPLDIRKKPIATLADTSTISFPYEDLKVWVSDLEVIYRYDGTKWSEFSPNTGLGIVDSIQFNDTLTINPGRGVLAWNNDDETLDLGINGVILQIGQEMFAHVKNQTGATIDNGAVVRYAGALGASGRITGDLMIADGTFPAMYTLGIATEDIPNGENGFVTVFGVVRGVNTSAYDAGDILYVSTTVEGALTDTIPESPNPRIPIAVVLSSGSNGSIFVRPTLFPNINEINDVDITSPVNGQVLRYDGTKWINNTETDPIYAADSAQLKADIAAAEQTLSFSNPILSISGGNGVDISDVNYWTQESPTELSFAGKIRLNDGSDNIVIQNEATSSSSYGTGSLVIGTNGFDTVGIHSYNQGREAAYQGSVGDYSYNQGYLAAREGSVRAYSYNQGMEAAREGTVGSYSYNQGRDAARRGSVGDYSYNQGYLASKLGSVGIHSYNQGNGAAFQGTVGRFSYNQGYFAARLGSVGDYSYNQGMEAAREGSIGDNVFSYGRSNFFRDTIGSQILAIGSFISSDAKTISNSYAFGHNLAINQSNQVIFDDQVTRFDIGNSRFDVGTTPTAGDIWQHNGTEFVPTLKSSIPLSDFDDTGYWQSTDFSSSDISNWNTAFGWGDHSTQGYITTDDFDPAGLWDDASRFRTYGNGADMAATVWSTDDVDKRNFNIHTISESGTATSDTEINLPAASATYVNHRITITSFDTDSTYNNVIKGALGGDYTLTDGEVVQVICSLNNSGYAWYIK